MPNLGSLHPQIVHFAIALLALGVLVRVVWTLVPVLHSPRWSWLSPMATSLVVAGTLGAVVAVKSGTDAHGPVERIPGARALVMEHEELGERTRNVFLVVVALEVAAIAVRRSARWRERAYWVLVASGFVGLYGVAVLRHAAEHGGELVYSYAGGVGTRSGDTADVPRLLLAGLYQQAMLDRREKRPDAAALLIEQMAQRWPADTNVAFLAAESKLVDRKDARGALAALRAIGVPPHDPRLTTRRGYLMSDAYVAVGHVDSARLVLEALSSEFPDNPRIKDRIARLDTLKR